MKQCIEERIDSKGRRYLLLDGIEIISRYKNKDKKIRGRIVALSDEEIDKSQVIGTASGENFNHCLYIGWRHADRFFERVYGYRMVRPQNKAMKIEVVFYEKKHHPQNKSRPKSKIT